MMKILIIGGTYFLGRTFTYMAAGKNELHLINRGNAPINPDAVSGEDPAAGGDRKNLPVKEYRLDRHDIRALGQLPYEEYDAVVDFCAYREGDIREILENLNAKIKQYVFISTVDVYKRGTDKWLCEDAPFEDRDFGGEAGEYILGKAALERELTECCGERGIAYTSLRPAFIYGPGNYAPREGIYFNWIESARQIIHPVDADGYFQMVYVGDVTGAVLSVCGNERAYNTAFNICPMELITYDSFADALKEAVGTDFERVPLSVSEINERGIPLPFPLTKGESNRYSSEKARDLLGISYIPLAQGLLRSRPGS